MWHRVPAWRGYTVYCFLLQEPPIAFVLLQAKQQASTKTMAATMEAPSALSTSQTYPTEAARKTAFSEDLTPELVSIK